MRKRRPGKTEEGIENFAAKDTSIVMEDNSQTLNDSQLDGQSAMNSPHNRINRNAFQA